jgi:SAM-dependent methyltransferase
LKDEEVPVEALLQRSNKAQQTIEHWRPPSFTPNVTAWQGRLAWVRRLLDLQAASIWNDLEPLLASVHGTLLDVGCGAQPYRPLLPKGVSYVGIDTTDAKRHFGYDLPDVTSFSGNTWPISSAFADAILCTETLEHVLEPRNFLGEAYRCLRPGGQLILTVPFAARWHFVPHDYWRFTPSALHHLLTQAGFNGIAVYSRGNPLTVACYKLTSLLLPLLMTKGGSIPGRLIRRALGLLSSPLLLLLGVIGNLSLRSDWGDDCLGFTVIASRGEHPGEGEQN